MAADRYLGCDPEGRARHPSHMCLGFPRAHTNAFKHDYPRRPIGHIEVELFRASLEHQVRKLFGAMISSATA
jgi:hypothetical protein